MEKMILHFSKLAKGWIFLLLLFISFGAFSQTCEVSLRNDSLIDANNYIVDIYVKATSGDFSLSNSQFKMTYNSAVKGTGTLTGSIVPGYSDLSNSTQVPVTVTIATTYIRVYGGNLPASHALASVISSAGIGTRICRVKFNNTVAFPAVQMNNVLTNSSPYGTIIMYSNAGNSSIQLPNTSVALNSGIQTNPTLNGPITTTFNVTGSGSYCTGAGGLPVGLDGSQTNVIRYQLKKDGNYTGTSLDGSGSALTYGNQTAGNYTVEGNRKATYMTAMMTGNAVISEISCVVNPIAYAVTGTGSYCQGGAGLPIGIANSTVGVTYTLYLGGVAQVPTYAGTGAAMTFGTFGAGTYTVSGTNSAGTTPMTGSAVITMNTNVAASVTMSPDVNNVCAGTTVNFTAIPTNGGTTPSYQWYNGATLVGTNSATYSYTPANGDAIHVVMTSNAACVTGSPATSATVNMVANPNLAVSVSIVADQNSVCAGTTVNYTATPSNGGAAPTYQWYKNNVAVGTGGATYSYVPVNGDVIEVVMTSNATCTAGNPATSNSINMIVNPTLAASVIIAPDQNNVCTGAVVTFFPTPTNGGSSPVYTWYINGTSQGNGAAMSYNPTNGDQVYAKMTSNATCATGNPATSNTVTMSVSGAVAGTISISQSPNPACQGSSATFTANTTGAGSNPYIKWFVNNVFWSTGTTMSYTPANNDQVYAQFVTGLSCTTGLPANSQTIGVQVNPLPTPTVSGPATANAGTSQTYTTQGGMTGYTWTVSAGGTITSGSGTNSIVVLWNTGGAQTVSVNYTSGGCSALSATVYSVSVTSIPPQAGTVTGTSTVCQGATGVAYSVAPIPTATGYVWSLPSGATIATGANTNSITVNYSYSATSGNVSVYGTNSFGNGPASPNYAVTVNPAPVPTISGPASVCAGSTSNVYTTQAGMTSYVWNVNGGTITAGGTATSSSATVTWPTSGPHSVSVNYANANLCTAATATVYNVTVNALPIPTISGPASVCVNSTGNVYTTQTGMTGYAWSIVGGTITAGGTATSNTATVTWTSTGAKSISVNYTNASNCTAVAPVVYNVTVNPLPVPTITGPANTCLNVTGNVYTTETGMTGYTWSVVGGTITAGGTATSNTATVTWTSTGAKSISVNYTNANSCTAATATVYNVTVNALPTPTVNGPATACAGSTTNTYTTQSGMTGYTWSVSAGGTITAGATTNTITVTWNTAGAQTVSVNYANANNCTAATATVYNVTVNALPTVTLNGPASVCAGSTSNVYTTEAGMSGYTWTVSAGGTITAGGTGTSNTVTVTWNTAGAQTVKVNYANANSCTAATATTYNVTVNALPVPVIAGPASACINSTGNSYTTASGMTGYTWTISAGGTITAGAGTNAITVTWNTAGPQNVKVNFVNASNCTAATATVYNVTVNPLPVPTINGSAFACVNSTSNTYSTETGMTGYTWTVSAGGIITAGAGTNTITVTWNTTGAQTVSVNYVNANGCTATAPVAKPITVNPLPVPTITGPNSACSGTSTVTYSTEAGMTNYNWTVTGGTIVSGGGTNAIVVSWATAGTKTVSVNYVNANGCTAATATSFTVNVSAGPNPTITGPATSCAGATGLIYKTEAGFSNYTWIISYGGTITAGLSTNQITVSWDNTVGPRTVSVNYQNSVGCFAGANTVFNVSILPTPNPAILGNATSCQGATGVTYKTEGNNTGYVWTISAGGTITAGQGTSTITVTWNTAGSQTVSVNYTNASGCSAPQATVYNVTVNPKPVAAGTITGPAHICAPATAQVYTVPDITNATSYNWTVPTGATIVSGANTNTITVSFAANATSGSIKVNGVNDCGSGTSSAAFAVTVNPTPATPTITRTFGTLTLTSSANTGNQWYKDGVLLPGATSKDLVVTENGNYTVVVTIAGCSSAVSNTIIVLDVAVEVVNLRNSLDIYPNPNNGEFNVKVETANKEVFDIEIYNNIGVSVWKQDNVTVDGTYTHAVNLKSAASGVYMVALRNKANSIVKKVIIMK